MHSCACIWKKWTYLPLFVGDLQFSDALNSPNSLVVTYYFCLIFHLLFPFFLLTKNEELCDVCLNYTWLPECIHTSGSLYSYSYLAQLRYFHDSRWWCQCIEWEKAVVKSCQLRLGIDDDRLNVENRINRIWEIDCSLEENVLLFWLHRKKLTTLVIIQWQIFGKLENIPLFDSVSN